MRRTSACACAGLRKKRVFRAPPMHERNAWLCKSGALHRSEMEPQAIEKKVADAQPSY